MSLQNEFGRIVQEKRAEKDYTQQALAELADITVRHMHTVEYGEAEVGLRTAIALADILDIDLNILKQYALHDADGRYRKEYDEKRHDQHLTASFSAETHNTICIACKLPTVNFFLTVDGLGQFRRTSFAVFLYPAAIDVRFLCRELCLPLNAAEVYLREFAVRYSHHSM